MRNVVGFSYPQDKVNIVILLALWLKVILNKSLLLTPIIPTLNILMPPFEFQELVFESQE